MSFLSCAELAQRLGPSFSSEALERLRQLDPAGDEGLIGRLLQTYASSLASLLKEIEMGASDQDAQRVRRAAHTLKSSSATMGALDFSAQCLHLEKSLLGDTLSYSAESRPKSCNPVPLTDSAVPVIRAGYELLRSIESVLDLWAPTVG